MRFPYIVALLWLALASGLTAQIPTPESRFGFAPGTNRELADWNQLLAYYDDVARTSDRVAIDTIGSSTAGLPFVLLTITSVANHQNLESIRSNHLRLADPRLISSPDELDRIKREAKNIVLLTSHVHSTEVGAGQMPASLLYDLATSQDVETLEILDRTVILLVPSLNPDGTQLLSEWYTRYRDTPFEGSPPVELYHPYVGHDNNRDWYAFTQVETQATIREVHNVWHPIIVHDIHQMGSNGARIFVPPYVDPFERNVDPLLISGINQLGSYMAAEMMAKGFTGVVSQNQYDLFTPARSYQHYHGGVRILSETASARLATPVNIDPYDLRIGQSFQPLQQTMNYPMPWLGGEWGLKEIVSYQQAGAMALLRNAARNRSFWIDNFLAIGQRAVGKWAGWPDYWVIPADQAGMGLDGVLRILTMGDVEVRRSENDVQIDDLVLEAGSYVIEMNQPYASWAQTMLEYQEYPNLRDGPGGPPIQPYDVTAHTLPLLMGIRALPVSGRLRTPLSEPIDGVDYRWQTPAALAGPDAPRIGIYQGWREPIPAGWTRWLMDQMGIGYTALGNADVAGGNLRDRFDVILFQQQSASQILHGWAEGEVPDEFTGGIGDAGLQALRAFVEGGGRVVAIESAADLMIDLFALPVRDPIVGMPRSEFYAPGAILRTENEPGHWLTSSVGSNGIAWFWETSRAFDVRDPSIRVVSRYATTNPRLSGWVLGAYHLSGRPAIIEAEIGEGSLILFGFQPNYRGHSIATWPLLFNALAGNPGSGS